jgi:hypothetical protein
MAIGAKREYWFSFTLSDAEKNIVARASLPVDDVRASWLAPPTKMILFPHPLEGKGLGVRFLSASFFPSS